MQHRVIVAGPHGIERFTIRITDSAFEEWLAQRDELVEQGCPDRPPDVDTATLRAWVMHPGEESHPYFLNRANRELPEGFPVWFGSWHGPNGERTLVQVIGYDDGGFTCDVTEDDQPTMRYRWEPEDDPADIATALDRITEGVANSRPWKENEPLVTTYDEFLVFEQEMALAKAEAARGFLTLPDGPVS